MHDPRYALFRKLLIAERERNGLTQVDVAGRLRKPQSYVSKYERGERRLDVIECVDIAQALDSDVTTILHMLIEKIS